MTLTIKTKYSAIALLCFCNPALGDAPLSGSPIAETVKTQESYVIVNQEVDHFLRDLARDTSTRIQSSPKVRGRIKQSTFMGSPEEILRGVSSKLELDWFQHNGVFFLSSKREALTRLIRLGDLDLGDVTKELGVSGLLFDDFPISSAAENSALLVTGPPRYLALVESVIEGIPSEKLEIRKRKKTVRVRRGIELVSQVVE